MEDITIYSTPLLKTQYVRVFHNFKIVGLFSRISRFHEGNIVKGGCNKMVSRNTGVERYT